MFLRGNKYNTIKISLLGMRFKLYNWLITGIKGVLKSPFYS